LLAVDAEAFNHGGTPEFAAISAVALRHNVISNTLSMLASVGIPDPARRYRAWPHEMSGGMAQRVVIAHRLLRGGRTGGRDRDGSGCHQTSLRHGSPGTKGERPHHHRVWTGRSA
jgi:hypothetical protein